MQLINLELGRMSNNCYILYDENKNAAIIDPAFDADKIIEVIEENSLVPQAVFLTHSHYDHIMGLSELLVHYEKLSLYASAEEAAALMNPEYNLTLAAYGKPYTVKAKVNELDDGEELFVGGMQIKAIKTPGHTKGSLCFLCEDNLFTGDTLFSGTIGRTDFPGGSYDEIILSLKKLKHLAESKDTEINVYPGHNNATTMSHEIKYNPYYRNDE